ncbi:MAG TPA: hypothetical protein VFB81_23040, partial [Myxococcales bacterium]|nr:hypothetical protein [Myxococcales bacterium]
MTNGRWLAVVAVVALGSLSGCSCRPLVCKQVGAACGAHDECCSFGCGDPLGQNPGVCACNPIPG